MTDGMEVQAHCPWCGETPVSLSGLACDAQAAENGGGLCEFTCPTCSRLVITSVPREGVAALRLLGAGPTRGPVPFELLEQHRGPVISRDDILELHLALEGTCCPQDEVSGVLVPGGPDERTGSREGMARP